MLSPKLKGASSTSMSMVTEWLSPSSSVTVSFTCFMPPES